MTSPSLTFVIPAYHCEHTLGDTVRSILAQTRGDWGAVIVDDGSTDGTAGVASSFHDPRIELVRQRNTGLAGARNTGFRSVRTRAVCFLDADDTVSPEFAEVMLGALGDHDVAACWHRMVGPSLNDLGWTVPFTLRDVREDRLGEYNPLAIGAAVFRAEALREIAYADGPFDSHRRRLEDWELWLRLASARARWAPPVPSALFSYRLRPDSLSSDLERMWFDGLGLISSWCPPDRRGEALRAWTVRNLARAIAKGDAPTASSLLYHLDGLHADDAPTLAGALRWAFCFQHHVGPGDAVMHRAAWEARIAGSLAGQSVLPGVLNRLSWGLDRWTHVGKQAAAVLSPNDRLVIYGYGRNGRECAAAFDAMRLPYFIADDAGHAPADRKMSPECLGRGCVVVVTPDASAGILERLSRAGVPRVFTIAGRVGPAPVGGAIHAA